MKTILLCLGVLFGAASALADPLPETSEPAPVPLKAAWEDRPYNVRIYVAAPTESVSPILLPKNLAQTIKERCRLRWGNFWNVDVVESAKELFPTVEVSSDESNPVSELPKEWAGVDKVFFAVLSLNTFEIQEFDTTTHRFGQKITVPLENRAKADDVLIQGLENVFSPLAKLEKFAEGKALLSFRGKNLVPSDTPSPNALLPFVRVSDRSNQLIAVSRIPWTVLQPESDDTGVQYRLESGVRDPLGARRRGRTEIYALAVQTPMAATTLRLVPRSPKAATHDTLPHYDVFEKIPGAKTPEKIGRTASDGTFVVEPMAERPVRVLVFRDGVTMVAQLPVVRGVDRDVKVPLPDDAVRLEAQAALIGLQEEMIDQVARRDILKLREKKFEEQGNQQRLRDTRTELLKMKTANRFHLEVNMLRDRFHSDDPIVERRLEKMFKDTRKMVDQFIR